MRKVKSFLITILALIIFFSGSVASSEEELFPTLESKKEFAKEVSGLIEDAWKNWQDAVLINDIDVEGSRGLLFPGGIAEPVFTASSILENFDRTGRSQEYIGSVRAIAKALENGMRLWQRRYTHENIPFPQGASCTFTLTPCENIPVVLASGASSGKETMSESALYSYMHYRAPDQGEDVLVVFHGVSKGISECFFKWEKSCSIVGIVASGGIAPQPSPMGTGPGPVRGAKGNGGKLVGPYIDKELMYEIMVRYFEASNRQQSTP